MRNATETIRIETAELATASFDHANAAATVNYPTTAPSLVRLTSYDILNAAKVKLGVMSRFHGGIRGGVKRAADIIIASTALVFTAPLFLAIALAIKLDSPGPVIFRQKRFGMDLQPFEIFKFRTMFHNGADHATHAAVRNDRRVTRVGSFLRRTSLDELPNFFNVLLGHMSVVGPRPHAIEHDMAYLMSVADYEKRFTCRPGVLGLAQLRGARGGFDVNGVIKRRTDHDLEYIYSWSIWLDGRLICTAPFIIVGQAIRGDAY